MTWWIALAALAASERTPVDLWTRGDCSLCQQFNVAVEEGLHRSPSFRPADPESPPSRSILVGLDRFDMQRRFTYRAEIFAGVVNESRAVASVSGGCDAEQLPECADEFWRTLAREMGER